MIYRSIKYAFAVTAFVLTLGVGLHAQRAERPAETDRTSLQDQTLGERLDRISRQLAGIERRLDRLEGKQVPPPVEDKTKSLVTGLEIITKGEQRVESLRKQVFELKDKEASLRGLIDQLDADLRPEAIERSLAFTGSLRPDELREARRRSLDSQRRAAQASLTEVQAARIGVEANLLRAEALVEKLRLKFEKDIETALEPGR